MEHLRYLESQFLNEDFADILFIINANDDQTVKIPSHKVILAAGSHPLGQRFAKNIDLKKIEIVNSTPAAFKEFLFTFYSPYPEKNFTIANAHTVLTLGKTFEVVHCIKACERFLLKNLPMEQLCFGYLLATEYSLFDLKSYCIKQINEMKRNVFVSCSFLACNQDVLCDILENLTVNQRDDIEMIWNACMTWAQNQCALQSIDASNLTNWREVFGKSINQIEAILSKDGEYFSQIMAHYKGLFENDENQNEQSWATCNATVRQNMTQSISDFDESSQSEELELARFRETILSPQTCSANVPMLIELQSTKRIALNGIAFTTVSGPPKGKLTIGIRSDNGVTDLIEQLISSKPKRTEPKNFVSLENVVLEPNKVYIITVELSKDIAYRPSRRIECTYQANDWAVFFKSDPRRDIFSHFFFSEHF